MTTRIDEFGRVTLPQAARDAIGLRPGDAIDIVAEGGRLRLSPVSPHGGLVEENGLLFWEGRLHEGCDPEALLDQLRAERERDVMGDGVQ